MTKRLNAILMLLGVMLLGLTSCSEEDNTPVEYPNWQADNATFFTSLTAEVKAKLAADPERKDWKRIKSWTKPAGVEGVAEDYILVEVLEQGDTTGYSPLYTDSVSIHYQGRLLPSYSYADGFIFDQSYYGTFNEETCMPSKFCVADVIVGFSTALQYMHRGDSWRVYIPQELGYGSSATSSIPAYSTLIFTIKMKDFWSK